MSEFYGRPRRLGPGDDIPPDSVIGNSPLNPNHPSSSAYVAPAPVELEAVAQLSAWQSIPGAVRFAVWLWALSSIVGFVVGVVVAAGFLLGMAGM